MIANKKAKLFFAIAGASCSGKTRIRRSLLDFLDQDYITYLDMDGYHMHDREERHRYSEFPDQPEANDFSRLCNNLTEYRHGAPVIVPVYNHQTGSFGKPEKIIQKPVIIVEGLHALKINDICDKNLVDFGVFLDPEDDLRYSWKVKRDVFERSYTYHDAVEQIELREPFVRQHVLNQRKKADAIVLITSSCSGKVLYNVVLTQNIIDKNKILQDIFSLSTVMGQEPYMPGSNYFLITKIHLNQFIKTMRRSDLIPFPLRFNKIKRLSFLGSYNYMIQCLISIIMALKSNFARDE